jgi:hypothetical protein
LVGELLAYIEEINVTSLKGREADVEPFDRQILRRISLVISGIGIKVE